MSGLTFNQYRELSAKFVQESVKGNSAYFYLGMVGEFGELCNYLKKEIRDGVDYSAEIKAEFGDVLWYVARLTDVENVIDMDYAWNVTFRSTILRYALKEIAGESYARFFSSLRALFFHRFTDATQDDWIGLMQANLDKLTARYAQDDKPSDDYSVKLMLDDDTYVQVSEITYQGNTYYAVTSCTETARGYSAPIGTYRFIGSLSQSRQSGYSASGILFEIETEHLEISDAHEELLRDAEDHLKGLEDEHAS